MTAVPDDAQHRITEHFDDFAPTYHKTAFSGAGMAELSRRDLDIVDRAAALARPGGSACDVGVGSGRISERLIHHGFEVCGVDASTAMLETARERLGNEMRLVLAALPEPLPLPSASFDLVTCVRVLKYLPDWAGGIAELARLAVPGGIVCLDLANRRSPARRGYPTGMVWPATHSEAIAALSAAGLAPIECIAGAHLPQPLWRGAHRPLTARALATADRICNQALGKVAARSWTFITRRVN